LIVADDPKACQKIIGVRANLDSFIERPDNSLANAVQNYHHYSKSAGLLEDAGTKTPHIISDFKVGEFVP
jgi:hypothetical protein